MNFIPYSLVSYAQVREKIFTPRCISCHGYSGGINLETYASVVPHLVAIEKTTLGTKTMPKNGALTMSELALLETWIKAGAPEYLHGEAPTPSSIPEEPLQATFVSLQKKIFNVRCVSCHSPGGKAWGVPLQTYKNFLNSPREIILPGNVIESGLNISITRKDQKRMPPPEVAEPLEPREIEMIQKWIERGALEY